jgi:hypothetical protein
MASQDRKSERVPTLDLSFEDNEELLGLCRDHRGADKKWLGGVFLRYGMTHSKEAMEEHGAEAVERTRRRRQGETEST